MSPPFHVNLTYGLRLLQITCVLPLYNKDPEASPRSVPVLFEEMPALAKPGKQADEEQMRAFLEAKKNDLPCCPARDKRPSKTFAGTLESAGKPATNI